MVRLVLWAIHKIIDTLITNDDSIRKKEITKHHEIIKHQTESVMTDYSVNSLTTFVHLKRQCCLDQ